MARRGRPDLVKALGLLDPRAATPEESRLRFRLADAGIIGYETAFPIRTGSGRAHPGGLVFPERRVILECRHGRAQTDRDARDTTERRLDLQAHGWTIVELGPHDLADPGMPRRVRAILARATR
ncbi:hypothetical protein LLS1_24150 [Leifsonia sp. LS1]|uniref:hypothetical protein n=1 Tax=Leifsonia sp. LS1 TaxID=2828483 RepID=UPI001CFC624B|nr:hypothetical protein [Leifsonia sp. LS1]GIT80746.1 hypothetical protein LLS1_24150 [Leifsonia sp. LS1]